MKKKIATWLIGETGLALLTVSLMYGLVYLSVIAVPPALVGGSLTAIAAAAELKGCEHE